MAVCLVVALGSWLLMDLRRLWFIGLIFFALMSSAARIPVGNEDAHDHEHDGDDHVGMPENAAADDDDNAAGVESGDEWTDAEELRDGSLFPDEAPAAMGLTEEAIETAEAPLCSNETEREDHASDSDVSAHPSPGPSLRRSRRMRHVPPCPGPRAGQFFNFTAEQWDRCPTGCHRCEDVGMDGAAVCFQCKRRFFAVRHHPFTPPEWVHQGPRHANHSHWLGKLSRHAMRQGGLAAAYTLDVVGLMLHLHPLSCFPCPPICESCRAVNVSHEHLDDGAESVVTARAVRCGALYGFFNCVRQRWNNRTVCLDEDNVYREPAKPAECREWVYETGGRVPLVRGWVCGLREPVRVHVSNRTRRV
ncbi:unnamed protein product [Vitrella brassicaformis CCMP3155]|uniref:Uncharacterized protein n=2 Tax=Vitrella brassicaformis TaxID=1169539 RepID=A0A0G4G2J9_VITBC|nr:unnamed protein product [Vitrella brassicaformis CCMP3155]|eukprot:CEM22083.1 unnamed protein product [Vitrella brassicaformis CCMP3155]